MALKDRIEADLKAAMKDKDAERLSVVRMLKSAVKYREIELMKPLDDAGVLAVVAGEIKRRRDSVEQYRAGKREDLATKEEREIATGAPARGAGPRRRQGGERAGEEEARGDRGLVGGGRR
jgi:uncharacterized protein YqeY